MRLYFIDVETTGLYPQNGDAVCEIAVVEFNPSGSIVSRYIRIVNPGRPIPQKLVGLHGISNALAKLAYGFDEIADELIDYLSSPKITESVFLGYNINFDLGFLREECRRIGKAFPEGKVIDVLGLVKNCLPDLQSYKLCFVAKKLGFNGSSFHWAEQDVMATAYVFFFIVNEIIKKPVEELVANFDLYLNRRQR